jgi:PAS domain S-box-containing protein
VTDILLRIIEEFADGFLILDEERRVVFFNEVLLRTTGRRSGDVLAPDGEFLRSLGLTGEVHGERDVTLSNGAEGPRRLKVSALPVQTERGEYLLVRVVAVPRPRDSGQEQALLREELFRNMGDPVLTADLSGRITCANPSFRTLLGLEPGREMPNISELYVSPAELEDKLIRLARGEGVTNLETHLYGGGRIPVRVLDTSWVTRDASGKITGYTTHLKDVTYLRTLESRLKISERNYLVLFDTILSSIIIVDPSAAVVNCNRFAEEMYGYPWSEIVGKDFDAVFQVPGKGAAIGEAIAAVNANNGRHAATDVPRRCRDGSIKFTYASYSALRSTEGETVAYSVMERDLTERVRLEKKLEASFRRIKNTQSAAILGFARLTEYRDKDTGKHLERIREYTRVLALGLAKLPLYSDYITEDYIEDLCLSSILHDVGKVGIEDAILLKPGKLSPEEFERIKQHATLGGEALRSVDREIQEESFLTIGKEVAFSHHERWDGSGYPAGKKGLDIPLSARIVALADVYDALTTRRSYKEGLSHEEAVGIISSERGTHFDPDVVDVFLSNGEVFNRIRMFESFLENPESIDDLMKGGPARGA